MEQHQINSFHQHYAHLLGSTSQSQSLSSGAMTSSTMPARKKFKRERESSGTGKLILIDGLSPHVSTILTKAIRVAKSLFTFHQDNVVAPQYLEFKSIQSSNHHDVLGSIMDRIEQVKDCERAKAERETAERLDEALSNFLATLHRDQGEKLSPAAEVFKYLWKFQEHDCPLSRRVSLFISCHVLMKKEECQEMWQDNLLPWITSVVEAQKLPKYRQGLFLWQNEARLWASYIAERFPHKNKFRVGALYLEQKGPSLSVEEVGRNSKVTNCRSIRDIAMRHAGHLCEVVEKLATRGFASIDALVPRIAYDVGNHRRSLDCEIDSQERSDDEDESVHWEEGDESMAAALHAASVERTLSLMQSTGSLSGGDLDIHMNVSYKTDQESEGRHKIHRRRLQKYVALLSNRYLPCMSNWLNAVTEADNLLEINGSLVLMSQEDLLKRDAVSQRLMSTKQMVASVLAAASRLDVKVEKEEDIIDVHRKSLRSRDSSLSFARSLPRKKQEHRIVSSSFK